MKTNLMPGRASKVIIIAALLSAVSVSCAMLVILACGLETQLKNERDIVMVAKLMEVARANRWMHQISDGHLEDVREELSSSLAFNLRELGSTLPVQSASMRDIGLINCARIVHEEKLRPDIYLPTDPKTRLVQQRDWDAIKLPATSATNVASGQAAR